MKAYIPGGDGAGDFFVSVIQRVSNIMSPQSDIILHRTDIIGDNRATLQKTRSSFKL
ncbi:hypothetical protein Runsl_1234 [Runella slithyformis DSM 19594]|uniref:Uncharacterized protein n=1 Tax=Runella slithyformis (strain ATCC 29530 / DSM 19594 / LMG 11500 / NCIMB 11436 / LSU 4) TaxID=761193 RepID=A0A7U3ZI68_RUNSL|nr:hypothetical protein Runsl_1234 [Runella slithyformis DSM 19594]